MNRPPIRIEPATVEGHEAPVLVISLDFLEEQLLQESGKLAAEDVPGLIANLCRVAAGRGGGRAGYAREQAEAYAARAYCGNCECAPCCCTPEEALP